MSDNQDLSNLTVSDLRKLAEERGVEIESGALKADIINALKKAEAVEAEAVEAEAVEAEAVEAEAVEAEAVEAEAVEAEAVEAEAVEAEAVEAEAVEAEAVEAGDGPSTIVALQEKEYLIGSKSGPDITPFSMEAFSTTLEQSPLINVKRRLQPTPLVSAFSNSIGQPAQTIVVAEMQEATAVALKLQAGDALQVEENIPYRLVLPGSAIVGSPPAVAGLGFTATFLVTGAQNAPVANATVTLIGSLWPASAKTDATGRVQLTLFGDAPSTVVSLEVVPESGYWGRYIPRPVIDPTQLNEVPLTPLEESFPGFPDNTQIVGWGEKAMKVDQLPPEYDGQGVKIGIIDSGLATTHRDLAAAATGGFNIIAQDAQTWTDDSWAHGSHVAGIIAGSNDAAGIRGIAPGASVFAFKVFPGARPDSVIDALYRCMEEQVDVVNLSLGQPAVNPLLEQTIKLVKEAGIACIVATGNEPGPVNYPASSPLVMPVTAIGRLGEFPAESNHSKSIPTSVTNMPPSDGYFPGNFCSTGPEVAQRGVAAPGVAILSSVPPDNYAVWDGTSMAAPHVAGLAALVLAHHPDFSGPQAPYKKSNGGARRVDRLFQILRQSAEPLKAGAPNSTGVGLPNALKALGLVPVTPSAASGNTAMSNSATQLDQLAAAMAEAGIPTGSTSSTSSTMTPSSTSPTVPSTTQPTRPRIEVRLPIDFLDAAARARVEEVMKAATESEIAKAIEQSTLVPTPMGLASALGVLPPIITWGLLPPFSEPISLLSTATAGTGAGGTASPLGSLAEAMQEAGINTGSTAGS